MIDYSMIYVYALLTLFLSLDAGLTMLANPTNIRTKGAIHISHTFEREMWKFPCHQPTSSPAMTRTIG
jgi:hypothetical protein